MLKHAAGLVFHKVGKLFFQFLPLSCDFDDRFLVFHRSLFAGETGNVSGRLPIRCLGVNKSTAAVVGTKLTAGRFVIAAFITQIDDGIQS
ncbi:hypothetical protein D3C87_1669570 [compost metagenome]